VFSPPVPDVTLPALNRAGRLKRRGAKSRRRNRVVKANPKRHKTPASGGTEYFVRARLANPPSAHHISEDSAI
jgi:hypothetical protein